MDLTVCPKCSAVSEIHWFFLPVASLGERPEDVAPAGPQQTVRHVTTPPMITIEAGAHLAAAAFLMRHAHSSSLVVVADNTREPVAMITEADVTDAVARGCDTENVRVHEIVKAKLMSVQADAR